MQWLFLRHDGRAIKDSTKVHSVTHLRQSLHKRAPWRRWEYIFGIRTFSAFSIFGHSISSSSRAAGRITIVWGWQPESLLRLWGSTMGKKKRRKSIWQMSDYSILLTIRSRPETWQIKKKCKVGSRNKCQEQNSFILPKFQIQMMTITFMF